MQINKAIGEKIGMIIFSWGITISGIVVGLVNGWSLALAMLAICPVVGVSAVAFGVVSQNKYV